MIVAMPFAAFAADSVGRRVAVDRRSTGSSTSVGHDSVTLRAVSPEWRGVREGVQERQAVQLSLSDLGTDLEDGTYHVRALRQPEVSADVKSKLAKARAANDDAAARKIMKDAGLSPVSQSGAFTVSNGAFVLQRCASRATRTTASRRRHAAPSAPTRTRPGGKIAANDQVIPDDLIVQGSACVGLDCVNNENFGFDTIRLKENNLRIHFDDTSTQVGFPANDWRLIANDSASGGSSKFSIEDSTGAKTPFTITAGAATNSIFVDSTGRIGLRTSTPVLDLHINTSNTPAIRLEQNNSGGFTAQTWDIGANEANFFVRDVTGGSQLSFRIRPGAPTSSLDISLRRRRRHRHGQPGSEAPRLRHEHRRTLSRPRAEPDREPGTESALTIGTPAPGSDAASASSTSRPDSRRTAPNPSLRFLTATDHRMIIDNQGFIGIGTTGQS